jgi:hypothetical protein
MNGAQQLRFCAPQKTIVGFQFSNVDRNSTFGSLETIKILPGYDKLSTLLILGDDDEAAGKSFNGIKTQLNARGYSGGSGKGVARSFHSDRKKVRTLE